MKHPAKFISGGIAAALLIAVFIGTAWIVGTTSGTRWLIGFFSSRAGLQISFSHLEGRLLDSLYLQDLRIKSPQLQANLKSLAVSFQPLYLLTGKLHFQKITVQEAAVQDDMPSTPPVLNWPQASGLISFLNSEIDSLQIQGLTYRRQNKAQVRVQSIAARLAWQNQALIIDNLKIAADLGSIQGKIAAGFLSPSLKMDINLQPAQPLAGLADFRLQSILGPGRRPEQLSGTINLSGKKVPTDQKAQWELALEAGMTRNGFHLKKFDLASPGRTTKITGNAMLTISSLDPFIDLRAQITDLDLTPQTKVPAKINGFLTFSGTNRQYRGNFTLTNKAEKWSAMSLSGAYQGNSEGVKLIGLTGSLLEGTLGGGLDVGWRDGIQVKGTLRGFNLNPAHCEAAWKGLINFNLAFQLAAAKGNILEGELQLKLLKSYLHGQQLTGDLQASLIRNNVLIRHLELRGKGFDLRAAGALDEKLAFTAHIHDFSRLIPQTTGRLRAEGWTRRQDGRWSGSLRAQAEGLTTGAISIAAVDLSARLEGKDAYPLHFQADCSKLRYRSFNAETLRLKAKGTARDHSLRVALHAHRHAMNLSLSGSYRLNGWQGKIMSLSGTDEVGPWRLLQPASLSIAPDAFLVEPLLIIGQQLESIRISAQWLEKQSAGFVALNWNAVNLARVNAWLNEAKLTGQSSGHLRLDLLPQKNIKLAGKLSTQAIIGIQGQAIAVQQGTCKIEGAAQGTQADLEIQLAEGGKLKGSFFSPAPAQLTIPEEGNFSLQWNNFDLAALLAWLPLQAKLEGKLAGTAKGKMLPGNRLAMEGQATLDQAKIQSQRHKNELSIPLRQASLSWNWQENTIRGEFKATLGDYGQMRGNFHLPVPARFPLSLNQTGPVQVEFNGKAREKGLLSALFPGFIHESSGDLEANIKISGTWREPLLLGELHLSKAGAYLPTAGISVKDIQLAAQLEKNRIRIKSFRAASGAGYLDGSALIFLQEWKMVSYRGNINGDRFQTIYLPEIQVQVSPKLTFSGTPDQLAIRGELFVPYLQVTGSPTGALIKPSSDVVVVGRTKPAAKTLPFALDGQVKVILGDEVFFKAAGVDARLEGNVNLSFQDINAVFGHGEINVRKGRFRTYGVNLDITRGRLFFAGGPVYQPTLDILALRTAGEVRAGVTVGGTPQSPVIKLYSEPVMPDIDILAYIVLGHPLGSSSDQADPLAMAATALLTSSQAENMQEQIKKRLGLSTFEIKTDQAQANNRMGYKPIQVGPAGAASANDNSGVAQTMLVVGKYLTPQLYISYGRSLFSGGNLFFIRYDITKRWQAESQTGQESGVDLYYKLEFN